MQPRRPDTAAATLKAFLTAVAAAAIAIGLALPVPHKDGPPAKSQFATFELGRG
jgi:hypothetical protein